MLFNNYESILVCFKWHDCYLHIEKSKEGGKDQESIQSNATPHTGDHIERISRERKKDRWLYIWSLWNGIIRTLNECAGRLLGPPHGRDKTNLIVKVRKTTKIRNQTRFVSVPQSDYVCVRRGTHSKISGFIAMGFRMINISGNILYNNRT